MRQRRHPSWWAIALLAILAWSLWPRVARAESVAGYDVERLADAIYRAEGGAATRHPYGIIAKYKHTTPRQACINTIRNQAKRHKAHSCEMDYLACLAKRYAPIGSDTDLGTNKYWLSNVKQLYVKLTGHHLQ